MINRERLVRDFLRLAAIDSPTYREKSIADVLESDLRSLGFEVTRDSVGDKIGADTGNVIASKPGTVSGGVPILLNAHMDTVVSTERWGWREEEGVIRSSGETILGADDKAGVAALMEALRVVCEREIPHAHLEIVFTVAEEIGLFGAKGLDYKRLHAKCAFVYDTGAPVGRIVVSAPSHDNITAKFYGKTAHSGAKPEDGVNAIQAAGIAIAKMKLGRIDEETTANVGIISGGTARNVVPDFCEVKGEARSRNEEKLDAQVQHMLEAFHEAAADVGAGIEIEVERSYSMYRLSESDEVIQIAVAAARKAGIEPIMHETGGGSDASIFNARGLPATVLGVGYEKAHSVEEYLPIDDFVKATEMAVALIEVAANR